MADHDDDGIVLSAALGCGKEEDEPSNESNLQQALPSSFTKTEISVNDEHNKNVTDSNMDIEQINEEVVPEAPGIQIKEDLNATQENAVVVPDASSIVGGTVLAETETSTAITSTTTTTTTDSSINNSTTTSDVAVVTTTDSGTTEAAVSIAADSTNTTTTTAATALVAPNGCRKVMIYNVLKFVRPKELQKMTQGWEHDIPNLKIVKVKKPPQRNWVLVTLASSDMVASFVQHINHHKNSKNRRGKPMHAVAVTDADGRDDDDNDDDDGDEEMVDTRDKSKKRRADHDDGEEIGDDDNNDRKSSQRNNNNNNSNNNSNSKRSKVEASSSENKSDKTSSTTMTSTPRTDEEIKDAITPLWKKSYDDQLDTKLREMIKKCARKIVHEVKSRFRMLEREAKRNTRRGVVPVYSWLESQGPDQRQPAIKVNPIVPSPQTTEYRNKCEFTFGYRFEWENDTTVDVGDTNTDGITSPEAITAAEAPEPQQTTEPQQVAAPAEAGESTVNQTPPPAGDGSISNSSIAAVPKQRSVRRVPAVGCMASGWSGGVSRPHPCQNIPTEACALVDVVDEFLATSPIPPYQQRTHCGVWRLLTMRMSRRTNQCMVLIQHAPPATGGVGNEKKNGEGEDYSDVWESEKQRLIHMLTNATLPTHVRQYQQGGDIISTTTLTSSTIPTVNEETDDKDNTPINNENNTLRVTSIFFQEFDGLSTPSPEHPVQHLFGKTYIEERLGKCTFQISPGAFFQVNTAAAEKLYQLVVDRVREVSPKPEDTILLDICCGTGTIGITCLKEGVVGRVLGVDVSIPAIENAKRNAQLNGFQVQNDLSSPNSARFVASRAELVIGKELAKIRESARNDAVIVAVVDPARDGLHADVVTTIRSNERIQRLVYVSCNPTATLVRDAALLCAPPTKKYPGRAFRPVSSQPVDMFPLTAHCEMVMTFERLVDKSEDEEKKDATSDGKDGASTKPKG